MKFFRTAIWMLLCLAVLTASGQTKKKPKPPVVPMKNDSKLSMEIVTFGGSASVLPGYLFKPAGKGPFPAVIFLTDFRKSLAQSGPASQFDKLARFWTTNGYVLFIPDHHPRAFSNGSYVEKSSDAAVNANDAYMEYLQARHRDALAATEWLKTQAITDDSRIILTGTMLGATEAILAADKGLNVNAVVTFSPGAVSWNQYPVLQAALRRGIRNTKAPMYLLQTQNDKSLAPSAILGKELMNKGAPNRNKVYPPYGTTYNDARNFAVNGSEVWGDDVIAFLNEVLPVVVNANGK